MEDLDRCLLNLAAVEDALEEAEVALQQVQDYFEEHSEYHADDAEIEELYLMLAATLLRLRALTGEAD